MGVLVYIPSTGLAVFSFAISRVPVYTANLHSITLEVGIKHLEEIREQHLEKMVQPLNKNLYYVLLS